MFLVVNPSLACASDFDTLLLKHITEKGVWSGKDGIIYTAAVENNSMLAIVSIENGTFNIDVFGAENEPADSLDITFSDKSFCRLSVTDTDDDFCISVQNGRQASHYRLVNDAFVLSHTEPETGLDIAAYRNKKLKLYKEPAEIYSVINAVRLERIDHIPYDAVTVSSEDRAYIQKLISACADIYEYDSEATDSDTLMRKVLYTHKNFEKLTDVPLDSSEKNQALKLCSGEYISSVIYNAFRKEAPRPAVNMLTELGYCYNNGFYYYTGGYSSSFKTEVHDIIKIYSPVKNSFYVVFSDTYTEDDTSVLEYSLATLQKDRYGYYITSLKMGDDFRDISDSEAQAAQPDKGSEISIISALPFIVMLFTLAAIGIALYVYFIR